jgi:hypothetical protein
MPSYWTEFFEFDIDPDELAERLTCTKPGCGEYETVDKLSLDLVIDWATDHWVHNHD